jgi:peptide/nickel transport system permease protein
MSRARYLAYRLGWTAVGAWAVLTIIFLVFALTPDPGQYDIFNGLTVEQYRELRGYDEPLLQRYLSWMESFLTLDLGETVRGEPIRSVLASASLVTLVYLVPSVLVAVGLGVGIGLFVAMRPESKLLRLGRNLSYAAFAIPTFVAAEGLFFVSVEHLGWYYFRWDSEQALFTSRNLGALVLPAIVLTANLLAVQLRYTQSESLEILQEDFVRTLRATGAGTWDFVAHVLKNGAPSLLSLFFSELVGVMFVVVVVVEVIFGIPGYGELLYRGIEDRDIGIILATTVFPILLVMLGNLLQDVAYSIVDPRIGSEGSE